MSLNLVTIPERADANPFPMGNYVYLIRDEAAGRTALVDAPAADPIIDALEARGWGLDEIWLTHHHPDHVDGVAKLREKYGAEVIGNGADADRLPKLDRPIAAGERTVFCGVDCDIFDVSGHTIGHVAFHLPSEKLLFTADSLMALGCGRLFEGTPEMMWASLNPLRDLDPETMVCSGHEYTQTNAAYALSVEPENKALQTRADDVEAMLAKGQPTVPSSLATEIATNPFLRADTPQMKAALGMEKASDVEVLARLRKGRDGW